MVVVLAMFTVSDVGCVFACMDHMLEVKIYATCVRKTRIEEESEEVLTSAVAGVCFEVQPLIMHVCVGDIFNVEKVIGSVQRGRDRANSKGVNKGEGEKKERKEKTI